MSGLLVEGCTRRTTSDTAGSQDDAGTCNNGGLTTCDPLFDRYYECGFFTPEEAVPELAECNGILADANESNCPCAMMIAELVTCVESTSCYEIATACLDSSYSMLAAACNLNEGDTDGDTDGDGGEDAGAGDGCEGGGDGGDGGIEAKAAVDVVSLQQDGVEVQINGDLASATIPLCGAVSTAPVNSTLALYFDDAVNIIVTSDATGISASFSNPGITYVEGAPAAPGEYTWSLNDPLRDAWTVTFYNETPLGQVLKVGGGYTAEVSVSDNPYIENLSPLSVAITVVE
ncbi:MAG: hypothetical protein ACPHRO_07980 [Nannocystaceae bacterium]